MRTRARTLTRTRSRVLTRTHLARPKARKTYTGKVHGRQDDLVIALQLACIGCSKFFQDPRYRAFRTDDHTLGIAGLRTLQAPPTTASFVRA